MTVTIPAHGYQPLWFFNPGEPDHGEDAGICGHTHEYDPDSNRLSCLLAAGADVHTGVDRRVVVDGFGTAHDA